MIIKYFVWGIYLTGHMMGSTWVEHTKYELTQQNLEDIIPSSLYQTYRSTVIWNRNIEVGHLTGTVWFTRGRNQSWIYTTQTATEKNKPLLDFWHCFFQPNPWCWVYVTAAQQARLKNYIIIIVQKLLTCSIFHLICIIHIVRNVVCAVVYSAK